MGNFFPNDLSDYLWKFEETGVSQCRPVSVTMKNLWTRGGNVSLKKKEKN